MEYRIIQKTVVMLYELALIFTTQTTEEILLSRESKFVRAYSFISTGNQTTFVCYEDGAPYTLQVEASSRINCILKCQKATNNNLRGINYIASEASCSCVPKLTDVWYNVTSNCPKPFEYVIEVHRCYLLVKRLLSWNASMTTCNNLSSHSMVINNRHEMLAAKLYALTIDHTSCMLANALEVWTSGIQQNKQSSTSPFFWNTFPGIFLPLKYFVWNAGEPNGLTGSSYCLLYIMQPNFACDDLLCNQQKCVLCEVDLIL
ncbi:hypothetical protein HELRODRAFT_183804 [Helobdella robusta]|uniref:C-type lectin domain-containing protein n=1 Tax=Helobdella robusta TaxID=6412 RepID=T1FK78_HELRO|nr:hypothetical protein HELRODRAFT_183804 [Helobdella robusta]ESO10278.1 hypothetical protein HELRODRAFT_183804 [Helobdella robusta]